MKEAFKNLIYMARRYKLPTALNTVGLILAFATFYLLMTQIRYQRSYNHLESDCDRLYRLECNYAYPEWGYSDNICPPFAYALDSLKQYVESYSLVNSELSPNQLISKDRKDTILFDVTNGNNTVVSAIAGKPIDGSIQWTDSIQNGCIIPESFANDYFGTTQATGDSIIILYENENIQSIVRGVYKDFPENSDFKNCIYFNLGSTENHNLNFNFRCYLKLKEKPQDLHIINRQIKQAIINTIKHDTVLNREPDYLLTEKEIQNSNVRITPVKNCFFEASTYSESSRGDKDIYRFLILGAIIVIVVSTCSYSNCLMVQSPLRIKSINTKLILGATRTKMRQQLILESIITCFTACLIALSLCFMLSYLPANKLPLNGSIKLADQWVWAIVLLGISIALGIITGWYPSKFATSFQPAIALKTSFSLTKHGISLHYILVFIQLFISMIMIIYIGILYIQSRYIFNSDYGFDKDQIIFTKLPTSLSEDSIINLYQDLININEIESVSRSDNVPGLTDAQNMLRVDIHGKPILYRYINTDTNYLNVMGIKVHKNQGRNFQHNDSAVMIVNDNAINSIDQLQLGIKISTGFGDNKEDSATVIGICNNIRYGSMYMMQNQPFAFILNNDADLDVWNIRIAKEADRKQATEQVTNLIRKYFNSSYAEQTKSFNNALLDTYSYELLYFKQSYYVSFICILLILFGLLCLTLFEAEYRRKEIGIRKVVGATSREIIIMLSKNYVILIVISFVFAAPVAYLLGKYTIDIFADQVYISPWIFPFALLFDGAIILSTISLQNWRAARQNPVNSIKTE